MSDETVHESETKRPRRGIAAFLRRMANRLGRGEPVPVNDEQTVTVDPPAETEFEVEVEREGTQTTLELEMAWDAESGAVETDATASLATFELYEDAADEYRWRLRHRNGNVIADSGEGYVSKRNAREGIESVQRTAQNADLLDETTDERHGDDGEATFEVYLDAADDHRWRLRHANGEIVADGGQGYASKQKAKQGLRSVQQNACGAPVEEL